MLNKLQNEWRRPVIFILMTVMMAGMFFSRAMLSAGMIIFVVYSFFHPDIKSQFRKFLASPLLWSMALLFFLPLLSGLWSDDKNEWLGFIRVKLPLLLLPLSFAGPFGLVKKDWERLGLVFILLIIGGTTWSMAHYLSDPGTIHKAYLQSRIIETPLENDHLRFSWLTSIAALLSALLGWKKRKTDRKSSWLLMIASAWLAIFLHILAARTGLLSFYLAVLSIALWFIIKKTKIIYGVALLLIVVSLPLAAYFIFPTFQNRAKYFFYDLPYFKKAHYLPQTTDAVRVISLKAGWNVMNENSVTGVGFGDILSKTKKWYDANYPSMLETDKIYPANEWLMYGAGCGWPGFIFFTAIMIAPFVVRLKEQQLLYWLPQATAAFTFLFDIGLEVQFGVFAYSFIVLCWWKWQQE